MNKIYNKTFELVTCGLYNTSHFFRNFAPIKASIHYGTYLGYLTHNWAPRVSYIQQTTAAYTLKKNQYSAYIVYGLVGGFVAHQVVLEDCAAKKSQEHYLKLRE